jgi:hypothetical protein
MLFVGYLENIKQYNYWEFDKWADQPTSLMAKLMVSKSTPQKDRSRSGK